MYIYLFFIKTHNVKLNLYLFNYMILIYSIQYKMKVDLWTKYTCRFWLTNCVQKFKISKDFSQFERLLRKNSVETILNAEMIHHLGDEKNLPKLGTNSRSEYSTKGVITGDCSLRDGAFEPLLVNKSQNVSASDIRR